ncbi:protein of unknown function [Methylocaldum szegediense]|uniref:Secreted protein n=1 Tax=Methylocaldum szegediense TaxID=73780 RepID=A0ABM9I5K4_9GAMM|nr:protein of unknown function [Methylocaldum szegediense]
MRAVFDGVEFCLIITRSVCSPVAQSVEQLAVNQRVGGSSPSGGAIFFLRVSVAFMRARELGTLSIRPLVNRSHPEFSPLFL